MAQARIAVPAGALKQTVRVAGLRDQKLVEGQTIDRIALRLGEIYRQETRMFEIPLECCQIVREKSSPITKPPGAGLS